MYLALHLTWDCSVALPLRILQTNIRPSNGSFNYYVLSVYYVPGPWNTSGNETDIDINFGEIYLLAGEDRINLIND